MQRDTFSSRPVARNHGGSGGRREQTSTSTTPIPGQHINEVQSSTTKAGVSTKNVIAPVILTLDGSESLWTFDPLNLSSEVAADPTQANYIAPTSDTSGANGAWVKREMYGSGGAGGGSDVLDIDGGDAAGVSGAVFDFDGGDASG